MWNWVAVQGAVLADVILKSSEHQVLYNAGKILAPRREAQDALIGMVIHCNFKLFRGDDGMKIPRLENRCNYMKRSERSHSH
jgi:hypothetical protein